LGQPADDGGLTWLEAIVSPIGSISISKASCLSISSLELTDIHCVVFFFKLLGFNGTCQTPAFQHFKRFLRLCFGSPDRHAISVTG